MSMVPLPREDLQPAPEVAPMVQPRLRVHGQDDPRRGEVERFIADVFARRFGACVPGFAPVLVSLVDPVDGAIVAAAGYRPAVHGALFLERYLPARVEQVLGARLGAAPERRRIVEIGHLAASRAGAGRRLMILLAPQLQERGLDWVVCTVTQELRHLLPRLGVRPLALAKADPAALAGSAAAWGSYYEHGPVVLAAELSPALRRFRERSGSAEGGA